MGLTVRSSGSVRQHRAFALVSLIAAVAIAFAVLPERAAAAPPRTILIVVDTSSSMYGTRLAQAKQALVGGSSAIPVGSPVGLRSYGGKCEDGGIVRLPIGPFNQATFNSAVGSLSATASGAATPTSAALRAAAATLPLDGDRTIVLISDGYSGCGDPCPVARELADRLGAGFRIDTVGFRAPSNAEAELSCIARVTGGSYVGVKDSGGLKQALAESSAVRVASLRLSPRSFAAAARGGRVGRVGGVKVGTRVRYTISQGVRVRFTVERAAQGRKKNGKCRKPTAGNRNAPRCTRYLKLRGSFGHAGKQGVNRRKFTGRLRGKKLRAGSYRLVATAIDAAGKPGKPKRARFRIIRR